MWPHFLAGAFVLVLALLSLQAWRFLRLSATPMKERLRGVPRCTAAELNRLGPGARAVVEGLVRPAGPGAPLPATIITRRRRSRRSAQVHEAWREKALTPPLQLATPEGTVLLSNEDYVLRFPPEDSAGGTSRQVREGGVACALVTLVEWEGRVARARAEWLYAGSLARCLDDAPGGVRQLRWTVAALTAAAVLSAGVWLWLGLSRPTW